MIQYWNALLLSVLEIYSNITLILVMTGSILVSNIHFFLMDYLIQTKLKKKKKQPKLNDKVSLSISLNASENSISHMSINSIQR